MEFKLKGLINEVKTSQRTNKEFDSCRIKVYSQKESKDVWISGFGSVKTKSWQEGDTVDVDVALNENGYYNFTENENTKGSPTTIDYLKEISEKLSVLIGDGQSTQSEPKVAEKGTESANMTPSALGEPVPSQQVKTDDPEFDAVINGM